MLIAVEICCYVSWCFRQSLMAAPLDTNRRTSKLEEQEQLPFSSSPLIVMTILINYVPQYVQCILQRTIVGPAFYATLIS